ncbi:hypothetical protein JOQ06_021269 [Pogonophryne albipinna]|uniref:Sushi domain-containing protein 2-like n=1 Tax=Pogonophryne albipinna TaxID=1090488 RepID=A0AAD6F730_9TELE|nr:hypothetical protein JOQ06_021269 [Pogonophryne albipinna]
MHTRGHLKETIFVCGIFLLFSSKTAGQTCRGQCGDVLEKCSCHATCVSLLKCCADYNQSCVQVMPHSSSMLGGRALRILGVALHPGGRLLCRFKGEIEREGFIDDEGHGYCSSPLLYETGWIPFTVSIDGIHFDRFGEFLSVHPSKADPAFEVILVNATQWQYYGTPNVSGRLKMTWNSSLIGAETVNIELWGYREFSRSTEVGVNGSSSLQAELSYLYSLGRNLPNTGAFSFVPEPSEDYSDWKLGNIRITASSKSDGARDVEGLWSGVVLGDLHFVTFDRLSYTFNGKGEYYLVSSPDRELSVQARTEALKCKNGTSAKATVLSSVAMKGNTSDVIEVRRADGHLQVLRNQKVLPFTEQRWMDLHGVFVFTPSLQNVTVIFLSGVGVEVRVREGAMAVTVLLPSEFTNHTQGLLGLMNSDPSDDLLTRLGEILSPANATPEEIFTFGASWNISKTSSLFTYDSKYLMDTYYFPPSHDTAFVPAFSLPETPDDPLMADMLAMCLGEGAQFCKYDTLTAQSLRMGNATLGAYQSHLALTEALEQVVSCGWLPTPRNGKKNGTHYLEGSCLSFTCNEGFSLYGSMERTCLDDGSWTGEQPYCITDDNVRFVLGAVGSLSALVTMAVMINLHNRKQVR